MQGIWWRPISTKRSVTVRSHQFPFNGYDSDPNPTIFLSSRLTLLERPLGLLISDAVVVRPNRLVHPSPPCIFVISSQVQQLDGLDRSDGPDIPSPLLSFHCSSRPLSLFVFPLTPPDSSSPPSPFSSKPPLRSQKRSKGENWSERTRRGRFRKP